MVIKERNILILIRTILLLRLIRCSSSTAHEAIEKPCRLLSLLPETLWLNEGRILLRFYIVDILRLVIEQCPMLVCRLLKLVLRLTPVNGLSIAIRFEQLGLFLSPVLL